VPLSTSTGLVVLRAG